MEEYVLHINSYLKDRTFYKGLYNALIDCGIGTKVFTPVPYKHRGKADEVGDYVRVEECYSSIERYFFFTRHNKAIYRAEKLYDFSKIKLIHAHSMCTNGYIAYRLSRKHNIPYIITVRNGDLNNVYKKALYLRPLFNRIIKYASMVVFLSVPYREDVIENCVPMAIKEELRKKSVVVPNGIDDFWLKHIFNEEKDLHSPLRIIYAGEINRNKNVETLIKLVELLNSDGEETDLVVVGDLKDSSLKPLLSVEHVRYIPRVDKEELINLYRNNDIFVMISKKEAFGLVYAEAMTQGLPIIYSQNQGFDGQFSEGYVGYHVNCMDALDAKRKILLIKHNYRELSANARSAAKKYDWKGIVLRYADIYGALENGR